MPLRGMEALVTAPVCLSEVNCTLKVFSPPVTPEAELETARNDFVQQSGIKVQSSIFDVESNKAPRN